jgi:hypothetical protein
MIELLGRFRLQQEIVVEKGLFHSDDLSLVFWGAFWSGFN